MLKGSKKWSRAKDKTAAIFHGRGYMAQIKGILEWRWRVEAKFELFLKDGN